MCRAGDIHPTQNDILCFLVTRREDAAVAAERYRLLIVDSALTGPSSIHKDRDSNSAKSERRTFSPSRQDLICRRFCSLPRCDLTAPAHSLTKFCPPLGGLLLRRPTEQDSPHRFARTYSAITYLIFHTQPLPSMTLLRSLSSSPSYFHNGSSVCQIALRRQSRQWTGRAKKGEAIEDWFG